MWKGCATASATKAGIFAALLAQQGMTGPEAPFEGHGGLWAHTGGKEVILGRFGKRGEPFRIMNTLFKTFPSQIHTQGPISLALELRSQVTPSEIEAIRLRTYHIAVRSAATEPAKWAPQTRETADHSIPYLVAIAFHDGAVTPASFTRERLQDPAVHELISKMTVEEDPGFSHRFPEDYPAFWKSPPRQAVVLWPRYPILRGIGTTLSLMIKSSVNSLTLPAGCCRKNVVTRS
jgi:2-methylcitrate dehydratase